MFGKYRKLYKEMVVKNGDNDNQVHNLNLYLYWLEKNHPDVYKSMNNYFEGMAGYVGDKLIKDKLPQEFYAHT